jgi:hypothetical protein
VGRIPSSQKNARGFSDERNLSFPLSLYLIRGSLTYFSSQAESRK